MNSGSNKNNRPNVVEMGGKTSYTQLNKREILIPTRVSAEKVNVNYNFISSTIEPNDNFLIVSQSERNPLISNNTNSFSIEYPTIDQIPLIFDSPHSGSIYPDDFGHSIDLMTLRRSEDAHVDELFSDVTMHGATLFHALFPRSYIDPNRSIDDIDITMIKGGWPHEVNPTTKTIARGVGLIWKNMKAFGPIYDRLLSQEEVVNRINQFWSPYHEALECLVKSAHDRYGKVIHINCHSMASMGDRTTEDGEVSRPDFIVSDRDGSTCSLVIRQLVIDYLHNAGFNVAVNDPYKGCELVRRHGNPSENYHSLQIEINRSLYMDEVTLAKQPGFYRIKMVMTGLAIMLRKWLK